VTHETAAARAGALLRQLDAGRQQRDDRMVHRPGCERPGTTTTVGFSVTIRRCDGPGGCGAVSTTRNTPSAQRKAQP